MDAEKNGRVRVLGRVCVFKFGSFLALDYVTVLIQIAAYRTAGIYFCVKYMARVAINKSDHRHEALREFYTYLSHLQIDDFKRERK